LQASAFESGSHMPFQPLVEALRVRLERENSPKDFLDEIWSSPLSQLLPELRQRYPDSPSTPKARPDLEMELSQTQLFEPMVQFTLALAKRAPLVKWVDDLQWADSATLDFLHYAIRRWRDSAARVLLLVSLRSEALLPVTQPPQTGGPTGLIEWLAKVERELTPVHLELEPLSENETVEMVQSILLLPAADFAEWVYCETRGQPFYLMESLKDLLERRALHPKRQAGGRWRFAVDAEHDLGQAVRVRLPCGRLIRSRLNRLSPNASSLLAAGAVLDQQIMFGRLCAISNLAEDMALPALDELISGRLLLETAQLGAASAYAFANDMLRDVVYTEAGDARRRLFTGGRWKCSKRRGLCAVLAHHAQAAGLAQAAFHHSLAAGREALRLSAVSEAIVHFERARQYVREASLPETAAKADLRDLYLQLGRAYELGGQVEKALAIEAERDKLS